MFDFSLSFLEPMFKIVLNNICTKSTDHNSGSGSWGERHWWREQNSSGAENRNQTLMIFTVGCCLATKLVISLSQPPKATNITIVGHLISMLFQASSSPTWPRPPAPADWAPPPPAYLPLGLSSLCSAPRAPRPLRVPGPDPSPLIWKMTADLSRWWLMSRTQVIIFSDWTKEIVWHGQVPSAPAWCRLQLTETRVCISLTPPPCIKTLTRQILPLPPPLHPLWGKFFVTPSWQRISQAHNKSYFRSKDMFKSQDKYFIRAEVGLLKCYDRYENWPSFIKSYF